MAANNHKRIKADRDLLGQLNAVKNAISAHQKKLGEYLLRGTWEDVGHASEMTTVELFNPSLLEARLEEAIRGKETVLQSELAKAQTRGARRQVAQPPDLSSLNQLSEDFPHFGPVIRLATERRAVANLSSGRPYKLPPILLAGAPGVGKTAFADALAACLGQPIKRVDVAASTAGFALAGSHESWSSARHGAVWALLQNDSASGVLLLDEIDKAGDSNYPVLGCLYSLLEPLSARQFVDEYMQVPVDASHLTIVATCNDIDRIDPALLSRFRLVYVPLPTPEQIPAIARSVYAHLHAHESWGRVYPDTLPPEVISVLRPYTPRELSGLIQEAIGHAAIHGRRRLLPEDVLVQVEAIAARRQHGRDRKNIGFLS